MSEKPSHFDQALEQCAARTGADVGFSPPHPREWLVFWMTDICEKDKFHTWFPRLSLPEAQRVWMAMEEHFLSKYDDFLRVWPEWDTSGIWAPPYPGSRVAGGMVPYEYLPLTPDLVERFEAWQSEFDDHDLWAPEKFDWKGHAEVADGLARDLKRCVGPRVYVEHRELVEVLMDRTTRSCRAVLGLPEEPVVQAE